MSEEEYKCDACIIVKFNKEQHIIFVNRLDTVIRHEKIKNLEEDEILKLMMKTYANIKDKDNKNKNHDLILFYLCKYVINHVEPIIYSKQYGENLIKNL